MAGKSDKFYWQLTLYRGHLEPRETTHDTREDAQEVAATWMVMEGDQVPWVDHSSTYTSGVIEGVRAEIKRFQRPATDLLIRRRNVRRL
jgi:hypothetical protein